MNRDRASCHARVLMVLEGPYPPERGGGAESQVRTLTRTMTQRGVQVAVVAPLTRHGPKATMSHVDGVQAQRVGNVAQATTVLRTGDLIRLDATTGRIERLQPAAVGTTCLSVVGERPGA